MITLQEDVKHIGEGLILQRCIYHIRPFLIMNLGAPHIFAF